jgi:hypothetical protein
MELIKKRNIPNIKDSTLKFPAALFTFFGTKHFMVLGDTGASISAISVKKLEELQKIGDITIQNIERLNINGFLKDSNQYTCNSTCELFVTTKTANRIKTTLIKFHIIENLREDVIIGFKDLTSSSIVGIINIPIMSPDQEIVTEHMDRIKEKSAIKILGESEDERKMKFKSNQFTIDESILKNSIIRKSLLADVYNSSQDFKNTKGSYHSAFENNNQKILFVDVSNSTQEFEDMKSSHHSAFENYNQKILLMNGNNPSQESEDIKGSHYSEFENYNQKILQLDVSNSTQEFKYMEGSHHSAFENTSKQDFNSEVGNITKVISSIEQMEDIDENNFQTNGKNEIDDFMFVETDEDIIKIFRNAMKNGSLNPNLELRSLIKNLNSYVYDEMEDEDFNMEYDMEASENIDLISMEESNFYLLVPDARSEIPSDMDLEEIIQAKIEDQVPDEIISDVYRNKFIEKLNDLYEENLKTLTKFIKGEKLNIQLKEGEQMK